MQRSPSMHGTNRPPDVTRAKGLSNPLANPDSDGDADGGILKGNFTLLGVSKEIEFPIKKIGEGKDPWGGYRVGFEGSYKLTREDFGMNYNLGPAAATVDVTLQIEAIKDK